MAQTKVIIMNGISSVGKDYISDLLIDEFIQRGIKAKKLSLKDPGIEMVRRIYNIPIEAIDHLFSREFKEIPNVIFGGMSPRQVLVHVCENVIKPMLGKDFFVQKVIENIWASKDEVCIISDLGFREELTALEEDAIFSEGYLLARIHGYRDGKLIEQRKDDPRIYLNSNLFESIDIYNKFGDNESSAIDIAPFIEFVEEE